MPIKQLFKIFQKEKHQELRDFSSLKVDIHSHLLAGIDDGANSIEHSLKLVRSLHSLGFEKLITTPHIMKGGYDNTPEIILSKLNELQQAIRENDIPVEVKAAAEYYLDDSFDNLIENNEPLLTFGNNYVLFELPNQSKPMNLEDVIFKLNINGYKPVLAHPERYFYLHDKDLKNMMKLKEMGTLFQMNITSLCGHYTQKVQEIAFKMIDDGFIDFLGTDLHNERHYNYLLSTLKEPYLKKALNLKLRNFELL